MARKIVLRWYRHLVDREHARFRADVEADRTDDIAETKEQRRSDELDAIMEEDETRALEYDQMIDDMISDWRTRYPEAFAVSRKQIERFWCEGIALGKQLTVHAEDHWRASKEIFWFIQPFWFALNLDRAMSQGGGVAQHYLQEMRRLGQLPHDILSVEDAAAYLHGKLKNNGKKPFYFREIEPANQPEAVAMDELTARWDRVSAQRR